MHHSWERELHAIHLITHEQFDLRLPSYVSIIEKLDTIAPIQQKPSKVDSAKDKNVRIMLFANAHFGVQLNNGGVLGQRESWLP